MFKLWPVVKDRRIRPFHATPVGRYSDLPGACRGSPSRHSLGRGTCLQHYELLKCIGEGSTCRVYKARDLHLDRPVALKIFAEPWIAGVDAHKRFVREARIASGLTHPNIVTVYEMAIDQGYPFMVMEYLQGATLAELMRRKRPAPQNALRYAIQIVSALAHVHSAGWVYRDLKPANVLVTASGLVKLVDFGSAKRVKRGSTKRLTGDCTQNGAVLGTVAYMSPEQVNGQKLSPRSDIFSFGVMFYEMLTGEHLFRRETDFETLKAITAYNPPMSLNRFCPSVRAIIRDCLHKEVNRRIPTMSDVERRLQDVNATHCHALVRP